MDSSVTDRLQNLKSVLYKVMGPSSITCNKYTDALEDAIEFIDNTKICVSTPVFRLIAETTKLGGIIIDLYTNDDEHLQTIAFDPDDMVTDDVYGDA